MKYKLDYVLILTVLLGLRALSDINLAQALVAVGFIALYAYSKFLDAKKQPDFAKEFKAQLEEMQNKVSSIVVKNAAKPISTEGKRFF